MYMRMVQSKAQPGSMPKLKEIYETSIIPALGKMTGCLHVSLLESSTNPEEFVSLTLWRQRRHADEYEASGFYAQFREQVTPYSAGASEYAYHLGPDLSLQFDPIVEDPVIKAFDIPVNSASAILPRDAKKSIFLRIVTPQIRDGMVEEFTQIYTSQVLPQLRTLPGCLQAFLVENVKEKNQMISLTIWHNKLDAENYERSGLFKDLTKTLEHCFTEMYQIKQQLGKETKGHIVTSEEMSIDGYNVIVGKNFM